MTDFHLRITDWYRRNKRDLPWRETKNPYFVWLSEIILQQTRVDQGKNYYLKFIANYPTIEDLAHADEQQVLNDWQGLGYYSRARNLHLTAKLIVDEHQGRFPASYDEIIRLKGIGNYTASAISSFCYQEGRAVLDGNVFRVLSRVFDIDLPIDSGTGKKAFLELAQDLLPESDSDTYNQGIMEFGALQCVPKNPDCENCEIQDKCLAFAKKTVQIRPVKTGKTKITARYFNYLVFKNGQKIVLSKRTAQDIWKHLYEFPNIEASSAEEHLDLLIEKEIRRLYLVKPVRFIDYRKHILSHQHIYSRFWIIESGMDPDKLKNTDLIEVGLDELESFPFPKLIERFFKYDFEN